ncbi:MAG: iron-sulfur cluster-binding domain-containing protein [Oscillospiraceae bacterium]|nr:iron-sulfur cluster-binding domain-containing protein [Oscillospiraceae bacterium]
MKIKGFFEDINGAARVTARRKKIFDDASAVPVTTDPIGEVARQLHPGKILLAVTQIRNASKTAKTFRFEAVDGRRLPLFSAGQYLVLEVPIGPSLVSRPYSISSAPADTCGDRSFVEITARRSKGDGFFCDYLYDEVKVGDRFTGMIGCGQFYYEPLRDAWHVVALAGGTGITPFASMAKEIHSGRLDMDLTILYGSVSPDDIILKDQLDAAQCERVHVIPVISGDAPDWKGERGFLSAELIQKYSAPDTTYFVCGPQVMYRFLHKELEKLQVPKRRERFEVFGQAKDITTFPGFPADLTDKTFQLTVVRGIREDVIPAKATESVVVALERAGIPVETGCRSGECGFCRSKLLSGTVYICPENDGRRAADREFGYFHACSSYPTSDLKIKIPIL